MCGKQVSVYKDIMKYWEKKIDVCWISYSTRRMVHQWNLWLRKTNWLQRERYVTHVAGSLPTPNNDVRKYVTHITCHTHTHTHTHTLSTKWSHYSNCWTVHAEYKLSHWQIIGFSYFPRFAQITSTSVVRHFAVLKRQSWVAVTCSLGT